MKILKKALLASIFIGVFVFFILAVFFSSTLANHSDGRNFGLRPYTTQTGVKGEFDAEREHGYCSDSHPVRGASTCPANGMPGAGP